MSRAFTDDIAARMVVPAPGEDKRMSDVRPDMNKRSLASTSDFVSTMMMGTLNKRRFTGDQGLGAFRASMSGQLAQGLSVTNTGFSTTDVQTDQVISQPIFAKAFKEAWQADYVEMTPLFCSSQEPETSSLQMYTVASPAVLNYGLEAQTIRRTRAILNPAAAADFEETAWSLGHLQADSAMDFAMKWNYLGPMTGFSDGDVHSSDASVRAASNAERLLNYSVFNRARIFNMFGPDLVAGDYLFWCIKEYDVSRNRNHLDPRGVSKAARRRFPAYELQVMGASQHFIHTGIHNSSYDPISGPDSFTDPSESDLDYISRAARLAADYRPIDIDEYDRAVVRADGADGSVADRLDETPQLIYDAYMEGYCMKVGYARAKNGRDPTVSALAEAHRSHNEMKKLQALTIYHL
jgi:hypothetical protein